VHVAPSGRSLPRTTYRTSPLTPTSTPQTSTASCRPNPSNHPGTSSSPQGARLSSSHPRPTTAAPSRALSAVHKRACARARVFGIGIILAWTSLPILTYSHVLFARVVSFSDQSPLHSCRSLPLPLLQSFLWSHRRRNFPQSSHLQTTFTVKLPPNEKPTKQRASDDESGARRTGARTTANT
jgi:hypothetical protein